MLAVLSQINPTVGDLRGNLALIQTEIAHAAQYSSDLIVFPEMATVGYPPRDLLYDESIWQSHPAVVQKIQHFIRSLKKPITAIVGGIHQAKLSHGRFARYNAGFIINATDVVVVHKRLLPCYDVFDETRYFVPAINDPYIPFEVSGHSCDLLICEDIWNYGFKKSASWMSPASYEIDPVHNLRGEGPLIVVNASPYWHGKIQVTRDLLNRIASETNRIVLWCNQVGGHDDIVFGGYSMVAAPTHLEDARFKSTHGNLAMASPFQEDRLTVEIEKDHVRYISFVEMNKNGGQYNPIIKVGPINRSADVDEPSQKSVEPADLETYFLFAALKLSLRDYCRRTGFRQIVFGCSGGIDSAVVGAIASIALGGEKCTAITMPSKFSSQGSWQDSKELARRCKMRLKTQSIAEIHEAAKNVILSDGKHIFKNPVTDENLQPRIRALLLMAESNDRGSLLLTTGNKSELAVGYCTIYGDMCGGYSLLPDVPKTWVYRLAKFINKYFDNLIPEQIITKPPSAELAPDQQDTDSLPPYEYLDPIIDQIMRHVPISEIKKQTRLQDEAVDRIIRLIEVSEYKRSQAPVGPKVTERAFGSGRRIPIAKKITYV